jgi:predicted nucleic acid-binding protein
MSGEKGMHRQRIYVDTSVIAGCLDEEFAEESRSLLELARQGEISLLLSDLLFQELEDAPARVAEIAAALPSESYELIETTMETEFLRQQYMAAKIVAPSYQDDALHVAIATVSKADLVVSWNFKHMLHVEKIRAYNAVNLVQGYQPIDIRSPREVIPI